MLFNHLISSLKRNIGRKRRDSPEILGPPKTMVLINHFSGHGVAVVGRSKNYVIDESPYIVWDGHLISQYKPTEWHDCMVFEDMKILSVQRVRHYTLLRGVEPVLIFSCKIGEPSIEITLTSKRGRNVRHGLASYCWSEVLTKGITVRDYITRANLLAKSMGFDQSCEVICRRELLDGKLFDSEYRLPVHIQCVDMCRVYGNIEEYNLEDSFFSP